ncbi:TPA: hypothetical protein ACHOQP_005461 [Escherichia coli]
MGDHHLPHELSQLYTCEVFTMRINTVTESAGLDVMEIMFPAHPVDVNNFQISGSESVGVSIPATVDVFYGAWQCD